jgi:hypothetical protein
MAKDAMRLGRLAHRLPRVEREFWAPEAPLMACFGSKGSLDLTGLSELAQSPGAAGASQLPRKYVISADACLVQGLDGVDATLPSCCQRIVAGRSISSFSWHPRNRVSLPP